MATLVPAPEPVSVTKDGTLLGSSGKNSGGAGSGFSAKVKPDQLMSVSFVTVSTHRSPLVKCRSRLVGTVTVWVMAPALVNDLSTISVSKRPTNRGLNVGVTPSTKIAVPAVVVVVTITAAFAETASKAVRHAPTSAAHIRLIRLCIVTSALSRVWYHARFTPMPRIKRLPIA